MKNLMISAIREDNILSASALSLVKGGATNAILCSTNGCQNNSGTCNENYCNGNNGGCTKNTCTNNWETPTTPPIECKHECRGQFL